VLRSHSIFSSARTVRPCSSWGGRWIGHLRTTWSAVCSSAPHSQAIEGDVPHWYKQERKLPTPLQRRLSRTHAVLGRTFTGGWVPMSKMKVPNFLQLRHMGLFVLRISADDFIYHKHYSFLCKLRRLRRHNGTNRARSKQHLLCCLAHIMTCHWNTHEGRGWARLLQLLEKCYDF